MLAVGPAAGFLEPRYVVMTPKAPTALIALLSALAILPACNERGRPNSSATQGSANTAADHSPATNSPTTNSAATNSAAPQAGASPRVSGHVELLKNLPDVVSMALPAVVGVSTKTKVELGNNNRFPFGPGFPFDFGPSMPGGRQEGIQEGLGSGVIISPKGYVLTNNHVVEGAQQIRVKIHGDDREYKAKVVGTDPKSDLAVIAIQNPPSNLRTLKFADSKDVRLGEPVIAIGNPFGLASTVTMGIISATGRNNIGINDYEDFIQTDAAINPGNSGGPLVDMNGNIVGINTAILSRSGGYQGIGFAIPSSMAQTVMNELIEHGKVTRGWLGVVIQTVTPDLANALKLPSGTEGVVVSDVQKASPAARAGLQRGDVIVSFQGKDVTSASGLRNAVALQSPGALVKMGVLRNGQNTTMQVRLGETPGKEQAGAGPASTQNELKGLSLAPLNARLRQQFDLPADINQGVVVTDVSRAGPAAAMGLRKGDVILEVNRQPVSSASDFAKAYRKVKDRVLFLIYRDGSTIYLAASKPG